MNDQAPNPQPDGPAAESPSKKGRWRITRRGFLIGAGVTGAGLALGVTWGVPYGRLQMAEMFDSGEGMPSNLPAEPWAWFEVQPDSRIRLYISKNEMGQGVHTSLAQIAVEELGIAWDDLEVAQATTHVGPADSSGTAGSASVSSVYTPLRQAAATLREMLHQAAADMLDVEASKVAMVGRGFAVSGNQPEITLADLTANQIDWKVPDEEIPLKDFHTFEVIGQPMPRVDIPAKVTGEAIYGYDVKLPGMKYGAVLRPPTIEGQLKSVQAGEAEEVSGLVEVVIEGDFAGVVADSRASAQAAVQKLQADWDDGKLWQQEELDKLVSVGGRDGITIQREGNAPGLLQEGVTLSAAYRTPFAVQTPLEAQAALAEVQPDRVRIWVSTQMQGRTRTAVAEALGVDEETVEIIPTYLGGGFGRKSGFEVAIEAARLAQAAGVPVHVGWTRPEEHRYGYFRPPTHHQFEARVDDKGQIEALEHQQASGDVAFGFVPGWMATAMGADFGATRGARVQYAIPNLQTVAWRRQLPVRTGWWRGLGLLANIFAIESFIDELAHTAGMDPLQFRLAHLDNSTRGQRLRAVLEAAAQLASWGGELPAGHGRGIACCVDVDTVVAQVAEVSVNQAGKIRVHRVSAAMDCGLVVNPDGAKAQVEGNIMWGVGSTLLEEVRVKDGRIDLNNFETYPLLTMREAPHVETVLLETDDGKPRGVGEPPIGPVAAAIGNALFAVTGKRLRQLPMTPERVLNA